jgi:hypothetical protein
MADYLVSSPPYEAAGTDKPALVMTGADFYKVDSAFLQAFERRFITYNNLKTYLVGIQELVADPVSFLKKNERGDASAFRSQYLPQMNSDRVFEAIANLH